MRCRMTSHLPLPVCSQPRTDPGFDCKQQQQQTAKCNQDGRRVRNACEGEPCSDAGAHCCSTVATGSAWGHGVTAPHTHHISQQSRPHAHPRHCYTTRTAGSSAVAVACTPPSSVTWTSGSSATQTGNWSPQTPANAHRGGHGGQTANAPASTHTHHSADDEVEPRDEPVQLGIGDGERAPRRIPATEVQIRRQSAHRHTALGRSTAEFQRNTGLLGVTRLKHAYRNAIAHRQQDSSAQHDRRAQENEEHRVVPQANAVADPNTVVVELGHAVVAVPAVHRAWRAVHVADLAEFMG